MAGMPPSLLAHFQQLAGKKGKKAKANPFAGVAPSAGTSKTVPGTKKPKKGKATGGHSMKGVPLTAAQKRLPPALQKAILRSRGFNV